MDDHVNLDNAVASLNLRVTTSGDVMDYRKIWDILIEYNRSRATNVTESEEVTALLSAFNKDSVIKMWELANDISNVPGNHLVNTVPVFCMMFGYGNEETVDKLLKLKILNTLTNACGILISSGINPYGEKIVKNILNFFLHVIGIEYPRLRGQAIEQIIPLLKTLIGGLSHYRNNAILVYRCTRFIVSVVVNVNHEQLFEMQKGDVISNLIMAVIIHKTSEDYETMMNNVVYFLNQFTKQNISIAKDITHLMPAVLSYLQDMSWEKVNVTKERKVYTLMAVDLIRHLLDFGKKIDAQNLVKHGVIPSMIDVYSYSGLLSEEKCEFQDSIHETVVKMFSKILSFGFMDGEHHIGDYSQMMPVLPLVIQNIKIRGFEKWSQRVLYNMTHQKFLVLLLEQVDGKAAQKILKLGIISTLFKPTNFGNYKNIQIEIISTVTCGHLLGSKLEPPNPDYVNQTLPFIILLRKIVLIISSKFESTNFPNLYSIMCVSIVVLFESIVIQSSKEQTAVLIKDYLSIPNIVSLMSNNFLTIVPCLSMLLKITDALGPEAVGQQMMCCFPLVWEKMVDPKLETDKLYESGRLLTLQVISYINVDDIKDKKLIEDILITSMKSAETLKKHIRPGVLKVAWSLAKRNRKGLLSKFLLQSAQSSPTSTSEVLSEEAKDLMFIKDKIVSYLDTDTEDLDYYRDLTKCMAQLAQLNTDDDDVFLLEDLVSPALGFLGNHDDEIIVQNIKDFINYLHYQ